MEYIGLGNALQTGITVMIFAEGTVLKPRNWFSAYDHTRYLPIGNSVEIIKGWQAQGADIVYCTSRKGKQAHGVAALLKKYGFAGAGLYYRSRGETYKTIVETLQPNVLIEDDCKSIGGAWQMCITKVAPQIKESITSIVVKEFKGIDTLPSDLYELVRKC